eukprot:scaffold74983_cov27-Phaeocystis_antarctica.AAC.2
MWTLFRAWWSLRRVTACSRRQAGSLASNLSRAWVGASVLGLGRRPRTVRTGLDVSRGSDVVASQVRAIAAQTSVDSGHSCTACTTVSSTSFLGEAPGA